jgi:tryptophan synthase alpha chain
VTPDRYGAIFARLAARSEGAFVPFVVLGDPSPDESLAVVRALADAGADALELGIPFSDPIADGPTIQAAAVRALAAGTRPALALAVVASVRETHPELPIGLLVYANLVEAPGLDDFYARVAAAGVDSVLVADVPALEAAPYAGAAARHGVAPVLIATPNASEGDLAHIAQLTRGYTYVVTRAGVTGAERAAGGGLESTLAALARHGAPPALVGFGVSAPEHVEAALRAGAAGAISGSAVVAIVEGYRRDRGACLSALGAFVRRMKRATLRAASGDGP